MQFLVVFLALTALGSSETEGSGGLEVESGPAVVPARHLFPTLDRHGGLPRQLRPRCRGGR